VSVFAGIDVGGTNIKILLVNGTGRVLARESIETLPSQGARAAMKRSASVVESLAGNRSVAAAGVGCAGLIDPRSGRLLASPNLKQWENAPLRRLARRHLGVYTIIDNDATCAAWGEFSRGANRRVRHLVFITLGTGVGGGIITDGVLVRGAGNFGGELGHMSLDPDGPRCRCGSRGCLEAYVGTYALVRRVRELLAEGRSRYLSRWRDEGRRLTPRLITDAARRGDRVGKRVVREMGEHLGVAIASLINLVNPEVVVVGGGVSASFDLVVPHVERVVARRAFAAAAAMARIEASTLGNDATAIGAAMLARDGR
jgi:glucokinase